MKSIPKKVTLYMSKLSGSSCHPKKMTRGSRNIPGSDLESLRSILLSYKIFMTVRTPPEELCAHEVAPKTRFVKYWTPTL